MSEQQLHGSCLCGGIVYRAAGPVHHSSHCYCTMCQKQHGAASGTYANVDSAGFVLDKGADLVTEYASSDHGRRGFCRVCGSTLYWRSTQSPQRIAVTLGTLEPEYDGPVERELFTDTKPRWLPTR
ncbi:GFA family protein [Pseudoduganella armeniaca]|uniref:GFA family protein n=1 Tax=Pseudoduganella armeniaca TaxID=2072590 RepID=A0A2R4CGM2_9BURK|nr:GFA family protein [Pseudoduganella armeniaca]AVR98811.1 GFA family protein [Pseudoduganella armeniaca]